MKYTNIPVGFMGTFTKTVTDRDNRLFADISGDHNPIHFDDSVARRAGYPGRISNGFVTESRIAGALVETFGSEDVLVVALQKNTKFLRPVFMGDRITATVEVVARLESKQALKIHARCHNQRNEQVVDTWMLIKIVNVDPADGA